MQSTYNTHETVELHDVLSELVQVEKPLNDDTGHTLAATLLGYILKVAGLPHVIKGNRAGTLVTIHYILQTPSGDEYLYSGRPDFQVRQLFRPAGRRRGVHLGVGGAGVSAGSRGGSITPRGYSVQAKKYGLHTGGNLHFGALHEHKTSDESCNNYSVRRSHCPCCIGHSVQGPRLRGEKSHTN